MSYIQSYIQNRASENPSSVFATDIAINANKFDDNPIIDSFMVFQNFIFGEWGTSWLTGFPVRASMLPFLEKSIWLVISILTSILLASILVFVVKQIGQSKLNNFFESHLPSFLILIIFTHRYIQFRDILSFDGYRDRIFDIQHDGLRYLIVFSIMLFTVLQTRRILIETKKIDSTNVRIQFIYASLVAFRSNLNTMFAVWIVMVQLLNFPMISRLFIRSALLFDLPVFLTILLIFLISYYSLIIITDLIISVILIDRIQGINLKPATYEFNKLNFVIIGVLMSIILGLGLVGFLIHGLVYNFDYTQVNWNNLNTNLPSSPEYPLGTNNNGVDNLFLLTTSFLSFIYIITGTTVTRAVSLQILKKINSNHRINRFLSTKRFFPIFILIPTVYILLSVPIQNQFIGLLIWIVSISIYAIQPLFRVINEHRGNFNSRIIVAILITICYVLLVYSYFSILFIDNFTMLIGYGFIISHLQVKNQLYFFFFFLIIIIYSFLSIISRLQSYNSQSKTDLYPQNEETT